MCGRFTLRTPLDQLVEKFLFPLPDFTWEPRFNIAPSQPIAAVRQEAVEASRELVLLRWGLVPYWAKDTKIGYKLINARSETVAEKPSFRQAFSRRRCLILSDGYYEWQKSGSSKRKQPYYVTMRSEDPFAYAGLWERWAAPDGTPLETCTILTTDANELTKPIHPRMPVILPLECHEAWLTARGSEATHLLDLLRPYPSDDLLMYPVQPLVNSPRNETPQCIEPLDDEDDGGSELRQQSFL